MFLHVLQHLLLAIRFISMCPARFHTACNQQHLRCYGCTCRRAQDHLHPQARWHAPGKAHQGGGLGVEGRIERLHEMGFVLAGALTEYEVDLRSGVGALETSLPV